MKARRDVFQAIADPTRRAIINMIATDPHNVNAIAEKFDITRQAISFHIKILADCGLLTIKQRGRDNNQRLLSRFLMSFLKPGRINGLSLCC